MPGNKLYVTQVTPKRAAAGARIGDTLSVLVRYGGLEGLKGSPAHVNRQQIERRCKVAFQSFDRQLVSKRGAPRCGQHAGEHNGEQRRQVEVA